MKNPRPIVAMVGIAFVLAVGALAGHTANAATATVSLASAANYSVLAGTAVTNSGPTTTDASVGVSPGSSVSGFPPGIAGGSIHTADGNSGAAQSDLLIAYNDAGGRTPFLTVTGGLRGPGLVGGGFRGGGPGPPGGLPPDGPNRPASRWSLQAAPRCAYAL